MPTTKQRRAAAQRKLQRQLERRAQAARKRRQTVIIVTASVAVLVVLAAVFLVLANRNGSSDDATASGSAAAAVATQTFAKEAREPLVTAGPCAFTETAESVTNPYTKDVGVPEDPDPTPAEGTAVVDVTTTAGAAQFTLDRALAPCAVQSVLYLVSQKFYDGSPCHRMVNQDAFGVLQCGDPSGTGSGGSTYNFKEEPPTSATPYPKGTIAMANGGSPGSTGSQFFIMFVDTELPAQYSVIGTVTQGLDVIEQVAAGGNDGSFEPSPGGGAPKTPVTIETMTQAAA